MPLQTPIFSTKLQIIASKSFIIICRNWRNMADSTGETVRHELDAFARKKNAAPVINEGKKYRIAFG